MYNRDFIGWHWDIFPLYLLRIVKLLYIENIDSLVLTLWWWGTITCYIKLKLRFKTNKMWRYEILHLPIIELKRKKKNLFSLYANGLIKVLDVIKFVKYTCKNPNLMGWISMNLKAQAQVWLEKSSQLPLPHKSVSATIWEREEEKHGEWGRATKLTAEEESDKNTILPGSHWELTVKINPTFSLQPLQVFHSSLLFHQILWILHPSTTTTIQ